jgi:hypothetical protein
MSAPKSTPVHLPWATLCHSRLYPPVRDLGFWTVGRGETKEKAWVTWSNDPPSRVCYQWWQSVVQMYMFNNLYTNTAVAVIAKSSQLCSSCLGRRKTFAWAAEFVFKEYHSQGCRKLYSSLLLFCIILFGMPRDTYVLRDRRLSTAKARPAKAVKA